LDRRAPEGPLTPDLPQTEIAIVEMTNAFRKQNALREVRPNPLLTAAARAFADYLARSGKFAHEADGREPHERAEAQGYRYCLVSENLALNLNSRGFETRALAQEAVEGWKNSPGHRANMLQPAATETGVAVVRAPDKHPKFISVQLFGRPEALKVEFRIENRSGTAVSYRLGEEEHELPPRAIMTHTSCDAGQLAFDKAGAAARFDPHNGDRFVVRAGKGQSIEVSAERK
jgi:catechol 2,3-dioxygenase-like lactoylglutathione lyase family enzyme